MTLKLPIQDIVKDEHLRSIGLAIAQWASVETLMQHAVLGLTAHRRPADEQVPIMMLTTGMNAPTLIGFLKTFVRMRSPEDASDFDTLAERLERAYLHRNILANSHWETGSTPDHIRPTGYQMDGAVKMLEGEATADEIAAAALHFYRLGQDLRQFLYGRGLVQRTPPDKSMPQAADRVSNAA